MPIIHGDSGFWGTTAEGSSTKQLPDAQTPIIMSRSKNKSTIKVL
jgi:hypothetical protein